MSGYHGFRFGEKTEPVSLYQEDKQRGFAGGSGVKIHLPKQETRVRPLIREDATCHGAAEAMHHKLLSLCSRAWELQLLSPQATATDARAP